MSYLENLFSLEGKVAIVTGGARGNGAAIASGLRQAGATVVAVDIIPAVDTQTKIYFGDITQESDLKELIETTLKKHQKIDILVNNAGVSLGADQEFYPTDSWSRTMAVNLTAPFNLTKMVLPSMKENGGGSIINITSLNAELGFPDNPAYIASKGGLKQFTKSLAYDYGKYGIRANNVGPGYIHTSMTNKSWNDEELNAQRKNRTLLGRWGQSRDLIGAVIYLASDASSYVTAQDLYVDGGWLAKGL
tara:strand:- start:3976 stop:4719 length:744 start_codon:yes stop_codon:yes gene_type:complete